ncbi:MAG: sugar-binding protein, partial [bacterium]
RGPKDTEAKVWLAWNADALYIAADVSDDFLASKAEPWQESLQIYIAPHLEITYSSIEKKLYAFKDGTFLGENPPFAVKSQNTSYQLELAIPWTLLEITPQEGTSLKFNAVLNDTDLGSYRGYIAWASGWKAGMGLARNSESLGDVHLTSKPTPPHQIALIFAPSPLYIQDEEVDIPLWLLTNEAVKGRLRFILKKDAEVIFQKEEDLGVEAGFNSLSVHWDARGKSEGTYIANAEFETPLGKFAASLKINKYDVGKEISSLQEEMEVMEKALEKARKESSWQSAVLVLQGSMWQSQASDFLYTLNLKKEEAMKSDPDAAILAKIFLWESRDQILPFKASSALIRRDFNSPSLQDFPTLHLPKAKEFSYLWEYEKWQKEGSFERLTFLYASLPIASISLWSHPDSSALANQRDSILADWKGKSLIPEQVAGNNWQGWSTSSGLVLAQVGNNLWQSEALSKDASLFLMNSALSSQPIVTLENLLPSLQPDILVEDISKVIGFNFSGACFYASKDDKDSLALAQSLIHRLGGKLARLEEVNLYKDVVLIGSPALHQLIGNFKLPTPERKAYILTRNIWGKNVLILVGREKEGTALSVEVMRDLIENLRDKKMLVGDIQCFTKLSEGKLSPKQTPLGAMGALLDFVAIADKGTIEGAKEALWEVAERGWKVGVIPGITFSLPKGEVESLGALESIKEVGDVGELVSAIHQAGGIAIGGGWENVPFDALLMGKGGKGKSLVAGTTGSLSLPLRTVVFSNGEGIYDILASIKRGDCLAYSPSQRVGEERLLRLLNIMIDERKFIMNEFSERARGKALALSP